MTTLAPHLTLEPLAHADPLALPSLEQELQTKWLVWDAWVAGKRRVDLHPLVLTQAAHERAVKTAESAWQLVSAAADRAGASSEERARYRFHTDVERLAMAARSAGDRGIVARVDLLQSEDGKFVACEVNADCPGGYNETLALPRLARAAGLRRGVDPTHVAARLADKLVEQSGGAGSPRGMIALTYATAYAEDLQVCALLERMVKERGGVVQRIPPTSLRALGDDAVAFKGQRVSVLYRFYPLEYMAGQSNIDAIERATRAGNLSSITSFGFIHAQSKLAMARAFAHDPNTAREVFPETHAFVDVPRDRLLVEREQWVLKRDLSRVGDHVYVSALCSDAEFAEIIDEIAEVEADQAAAGNNRDGYGQVWIAQRFVPQMPVDTPWGARLVTLGAYLIDGAFAGYFARLSAASHCTHDSLVVPVFLRGAD